MRALMPSHAATPESGRLAVDANALSQLKAKAKSAPAVILLHMCNTDRKSWTPVAEQWPYSEPASTRFTRVITRS